MSRRLIRDGQLIVEISDDGVGFPPDQVFGRGLTGMQERVRALSGTFELLREAGRTRVRCRLPVGDATLGAAPRNRRNRKSGQASRRSGNNGCQLPRLPEKVAQNRNPGSGDQFRLRAERRAARSVRVRPRSSFARSLPSAVKVKKRRTGLPSKVQAVEHDAVGIGAISSRPKAVGTRASSCGRQ